MSVIIEAVPKPFFHHYPETALERAGINAREKLFLVEERNPLTNTGYWFHSHEHWEFLQLETNLSDSILLLR